MINVVRMNPSGIDGIRTIMTFEFTFDNPNELPKNAVYTMNQVIYVIANNSIAISNIDNSVYKFNGKQWIKTGDKITPNNMNNITSNGNYILSSSPTSTNTNVSVNVESEPNIDSLSITENGVYNALEEGLDGFSTVDVNVSVTGIPKLASPSALATEFKNFKRQSLYINNSNASYPNSVQISPQDTYSKNSSNTTVCIVPYPKNSISFPNDKSMNNTCVLVFTAASGTVSAQYYSSNIANWKTINLDYNFTVNKVYKIVFSIEYIQGYISSFTVTSINEYNEPITFTVE